MRVGPAEIRRWVLVLILAAAKTVYSFAPSWSLSTSLAFSSSATQMTLSSGADSGHHGKDKWRQQQEASLESMAAAGASKIAQMDINERTKRAMLAEAVENRIFQLQQELLELAQTNGKFSQAKKLAQQIKLAQEQYQELVSGDPSDMLRAFDSLASMNQDE